MSRAAPDLHLLPHQFTTEQAVTALRWGGSPKGLALLLSANGFVKTVRRTDSGSRRVWIRSKNAARWKAEQGIQRLRDDHVKLNIAHGEHPQCACQCHENTCGAAAMDMAERTLRLITSLRPMSTDMVERLDELVQRAGPAHARTALENFSPDDGVPF